MPKGTIEPGDGNGPGGDKSPRSTIKCKSIKITKPNGTDVWEIPEANIPILAHYDAALEKELAPFVQRPSAKKIEVSFDVQHFSFGGIDYLGAVNVKVLKEFK